MFETAIENEFVEDFKTANSRCYVRSQMGFLMKHNGIRPGLSGVLGTTGSGKSALLQKIICDTAMSEPVLVWLSEEKIIQYQMQLSKVNTYSEKVHKNLRFVEEKNIPKSATVGQESFFEYFRAAVARSNCKYIFIDNLTTSSYFYSDLVGIQGQEKTARFLNDDSWTDAGISIFYAMHTQSGISNNTVMIRAENNRGSKKITAVTPYLYTLTVFSTNGKRFPIITNEKHRFHQAGGYFLLGFENGSYKFDMELKFEDVRKIFKNRDRLGV